MSRRKQNQEFDGLESNKNRFDKSNSAASDENAEAILKAGFDSLKSEMDNPSDLKALRYQIETSSSRKESSFMSQLQNKITSHPRFSLIFATTVAVLLFVVLVPFSYHKTIGYQIEYAVGDIAKAPSLEAINAALLAIGQNEAKATFAYDEDTGTCTVSILPNLKAVRETQALFSSIMGMFTDPKITPVVELVSGSLYAQVKDKAIKVEVDATDKTDQQIQDEIKAKLEAQGFKGSVIYVKSDRDNHGSDSTRQLKFELTVKGDSCIGSANANAELLQIDSRGKTPEQIQAEIQKRLNEKGISNAKVQVTGEQSGDSTKQRLEIKIVEEPE
jgi:hypothetical protein